MNKPKLNGFHKFLSLLLAATILILALGFAVSGWDGNNQSPDYNSGDVGGTNDNADENKNPVDNNDGDSLHDQTQLPDDSIIDVTPTYKNVITGLSVTQKEYEATPFGVVIDSSSPFYGVSDSDIMFEFPIEDGTSRMLCYLTNEEILWKIGALKATRNYISNMSDFFGGVVVSYGNDHTVNYDAWETDRIELDLSEYSDCYYSENTLYIYTTEGMIESAKNRLPTNTSIQGYKNPPYEISDNEKIHGITSAKNASIPYSKDNTTTLSYNESENRYEYYKNGVKKVDMLTGKEITFTNVFVLFADATFYENSQGTELVLDTSSGGKGYYISMGMMTEFRWDVNSAGELVFEKLTGETLRINAGNSYIAYCRASATYIVEIS